MCAGFSSQHWWQFPAAYQNTHNTTISIACQAVILRWYTVI